MLLGVLVLLLIKKHTGLLSRNRQAVCFKSHKRMNIEMKRKLSIFQYGSQFDPTGPTRYSPSDWIEISFSESSPSEGSCSIGAPPVSNSSASEASTGIRDELTYYSPLDHDLSEEFRNVCLFFKGQIEYIGADLPSTWTLEGPAGAWGRGGLRPLLSIGCLFEPFRVWLS